MISVKTKAEGHHHSVWQRPKLTSQIRKNRPFCLISSDILKISSYLRVQR